MEKAGVKVELSTQVSAEFVQEERPDVVIIATGAKPSVPNIPGIEGENVVTAKEVLTGRKSVDGRAVIVGGELVAVDVAEFLAEKGNDVKMVRRGPTIVAKMVPQLKSSVLSRLSEKGVDMLTDVNYEEITGRGLVITDRGGKGRTLEADTIVVAARARPNDKLTKELEGKALTIKEIGDCVEPRRIGDAIREGAEVSREI